MQELEQLTIRSADDLASLEDEWDCLAARCPGYFLSQTFRWAQTAWQTVARPGGRELAGVALRFEGRLVAVWPLVAYRERGLRIIRPLGSESSEYCAPLVEPSDQAQCWIELLWRAAASSADLVLLPHVRADSLLAGVIERDGNRRFAEDTLRAPYVARKDHVDWTGYQGTVSSSHRSGLRRKRRRLVEAGKVTFGRESAAGTVAAIDWMLDHKKRWLARQNLANDWIDRADYRDFLVALTAGQGALGDMALFVLKLDGVPIAAQLNSVDRSRIEFYIGVYDAEWGSYSPGEIVTEACLQWAFERGLDYDFRIGVEAYKSTWAKRSLGTVTFHVATTKRGVATLVRLHVRTFVGRIRQKLALGRFLPPAWRRSPRRS
jgi:CelD/BcsL family acetyltransferase involved in cellulose biosynthesis